MTEITRDHLLELLPAHYRERDESGALREFLGLLSGELAVVADGIDQLYDDLFAETAAPWVLPYLAELIGLRGLPGASIDHLTSRAEVAGTIGYRRRKGTAAVIEQVAHDVTGWPAKAVECFELLAATQHLDHVRRHSQVTANVRVPSRLQFVHGPFERGARSLDRDDTERADAAFSHLPDMRGISRAGGRYNLPNISVHLWRLSAQPVSHSPAVPWLPGDGRRFLFDPLGAPVQLFTQALTEADISQQTQPANVPMPIARLMLHDWPSDYYGDSLSVFVTGFTPTPAGEPGPSVIVESAHLGDLPGGGWGNLPSPPSPGDVVVRIDPVLGRLAFSADQVTPPMVAYHRGFSADIGGGEYDRIDSFADVDGDLARVAHGAVPPAAHPTIADALTRIATGVGVGGIVEVTDNHRYDAPAVVTARGIDVEVRSDDQCRPIVLATGDIVIDLDDPADRPGTVFLNGLVISGGMLRVRGRGILDVRHCTLVPGSQLQRDGSPLSPGAVSISVDDPRAAVRVSRSILGGIRAHVDADVTCSDSIIDAGEAGIAFAADTADDAAGGTLTLDECTVFGRVHARVLERVSNSIVIADVPTAEAVSWPAPVIADRRQRGCIRFSYLPPGSRTPRRFRGVAAADAAAFRPVFTSTRFGDPGYGQLAVRTPDAVWRGAEDESEMGALHHLNQPLREAYLERRLEDYTRFGLEVGLVYET